jgi:hypothetical protein
VNTQPIPTLAISVRVPEALQLQVRDLAHRENCSVAELVRRALEREIERELA